jgi:hypothetical protein
MRNMMVDQSTEPTNVQQAAGGGGGGGGGVSGYEMARIGSE